MTEAERLQEAERLFGEGTQAESDGREDEAMGLIRRAALMGEVSAWIYLGCLLTDRGGRDYAGGMRWLKRAAWRGEAMAAWNLAMQYRIDERPAPYLRWMRVAARLGWADAPVVLAEIDRRRAAGQPWAMLKQGHVDALDLEWELEDVRDGKASAAKAAEWAEGVIHRRWAAGVAPADRERLLPVLWEMAAPGLTPQRAAELIYKLTA
ncbi:hypothetical protein [Caulobacter sp. 17J80-11]|uniref:hypothetical protein n=1 Tax=Caulobacter sp. 17J80-11 TaxID=2763502 RepID=UPI001653C3B4|nr:hypothetical protein [Caulobacter sp. 17J80-11]MBC6981438.1 hypothetical protein [Caulobacter sp. 17J80-11]